jgi:hypothetical protein
MLAFVLCLVSTTLFAQDGARKKSGVNYRVPARKYQKITVSGREFIVEKQLLVESPAVADRVLLRLKKNINLALSILPLHSHKHVAKQRFYVMYGPMAKGGGRGNGLAYFRPGSPKFDANRDEDWNSVVVVWHAENYMKLTDLWALKCVLHELAHAYQLEQYPEKQPDILNAWKNAMEQKLYHNVKEDTGKILQAAYATQNQLEYFAEVSCMFFAKCNYAPTNRSELKAYDPTGYEMIRKIWKIGDKHGQREPRVWKLGPKERKLTATFSARANKRVTLVDEKNRKRNLSIAALSQLDRDYISLWLDD